MAKDPAFLFYSSDFLTGTMFMSNEQVGMYIRLLCAQHQKGRLTEKDMINICKTHDEDVFSKFVKDENGLYYNVRCEDEVNKRRKYSESRRSNRQSIPNKQTYDKHMSNISKSYVKHMENENENIIEIKDDNKNEKYSFDDFWNFYDKKVGDKDKIKKKYNKLSETDKEKIFNHLMFYKQSQPDKKFRKNPETYLNNKSWNDEIIQSGDLDLLKEMKKLETFKEWENESN